LLIQDEGVNAATGRPRQGREHDVIIVCAVFLSIRGGGADDVGGDCGGSGCRSRERGRRVPLDAPVLSIFGGAEFEVCGFKGRRNVGLRDDDFWGLGFGMLASW